ncbi:MAG: hypothetical protein ACRDCE_08845 [Cetobacterium sp.]|uniref:hypothetical protein n=1 Tax=Cetobacterium sp. TaxID=2071632 RepID=UPI003EE5C9A2
MAKKWSEVVSSEGFQALGPEEQAQAQRQYFDTVVAPQAQEAGYDLAQVENQFFTENALTQPEVMNEQTPEVMVSPVEVEPDLTQQTVMEQPIPGADWGLLPSFEQQPQAPIMLPEPTPAEQAADWSPQMPPPRISRRTKAGREAQTSRWAETAQPSNVNPGYRADGSVNRDDPRWRGMDEYQIASQMAADERVQLWNDLKNLIPSNIGERDAYTQQVQSNIEDLKRPLSQPIGKQTRERTPEELAAFYGTTDEAPSVWDKANIKPEDIPIQAAEQGYSLLDAVYTDKANFMAQGMSEEAAEKAAFEKAQRDSAQFAAGVATAPVLGAGALATMPLRMAGAGAVNTLAGGAADLAAGKEPKGGQMLEDFAYGTLGGLGIGGGRAAAASRVADDVANLKSAAIQDVDALAKQAQAKQAMASGKKGQAAMNEVLEGTETITAKDVLKAQDTVSTLTKVNQAGGKVDLNDALSSIKNPELRAMLEKTAPIRSVVQKGEQVVDDMLGMSSRELLGLGNEAGAKRANRQAMDSVAVELGDTIEHSRQSINDAFGFTGAVDKSFNKTFDHLAEAQMKLTEGNFSGAKKTLNRIQGTQGDLRRLFGSTAADEIVRLRNELKELVKVAQGTKGYSQPKGVFEQVKGLSIPAAIGFGVDPITGVAVQGAKMAGRSGVNKINAKKLEAVEQALGGKLKFDETAERMLAEGQEMGAVIGYLIAKMLREE